ncbi:MAG: hypothetical protein JJ902_16930 [Roseibium sp.]|nr:hypothetical protein [Roseibium sp.]
MGKLKRTGLGVALLAVAIGHAAQAAQIQSAVCDRAPGEPNKATVTVTVAPSAQGDVINSANMTGDMIAEFNTQAINVACPAGGAGVYTCTSRKTFGMLRTVTNVEYSINGQQTLNGAHAQTPFAIRYQGVLCN